MSDFHKYRLKIPVQKLFSRKLNFSFENFPTGFPILLNAENKRFSLFSPFSFVIEKNSAQNFVPKFTEFFFVNFLEIWQQKP